MIHTKWLVSMVLLATFGCSADGAQGTGPDSDGPTGNLALNLSAQDSAGETYRLRNAEFQISGYSYATGQEIYTNTTVSSETDPERPVITTRLLEGYYGVAFNSALPWFMEHVTPAGTEPVAKAIFLGPASASAYVYPHSTSTVSFRFGINGELVDFYGGDLEIGITVEGPPVSAGGTSSDGAAGGGGFGGFLEGGAGGAF